MHSEANKRRTADTPQTTDIQPITPTDYLQFVASQLPSATPGDIEDRAIRSLLPLSSLSADSLSSWGDLLLRWNVTHALRGLSPATRRRYLGKLHTIYLLLPGATAATDPFLSKDIREALSLEATLDTAVAEANLRHLPRLTEILADSESPRLQTAAVTLHLLLDPRIGISTAVRLRHGDPLPDCEQIRELADAARRDPRQQYLYSLGQRTAREPRLIRDLTRAIADLLTAVGMKLPAVFSAETLRALWASRALSLGLPLGKIRAMLPAVPHGLEPLSAIAPDTLADGEADDIIRRVADSLLDFGPAWHVMRLRARVTPDDIRQRIHATLPRLLPHISFYYPMRRIARKEDRKITYTEQPYLPGVLFFRTRRDNVARLMRQIGDAAWAYRTANTPDAPYSVIPRRQMLLFQSVTGGLTDDINLTLSDHKDLGPGRRVRITAGVMQGYEGVIYDHGADTPDGLRTFTLDLSADTTLRWQVQIPETSIQPIDR